MEKQEKQVGTNLDKLFKTNSKEEVEGIFIEVAEGVKFQCRRFGGQNSQKLKAVMAKHFKPYASQISAGSLSSKKDQEITTKVFVETCLVGWEGVEIDGVLQEFSIEKAIEVLTGLPELTQFLIRQCEDPNNYRAALGNS